MKITVCTPTRGSFEAGSAIDLARMGVHAARGGVDIQFHTLEGTFIFDQREKLVEGALEKGTDGILWVDCDMRFPPDSLMRLLAHRKEIVGVNAVRRRYPLAFTAFQKREDGRFSEVSSVGKKGLQQVSVAGCGFLLVQARVYHKCERPWFWVHGHPDGGIALGEDAHFCLNAGLHDFSVWVDHDLSQEIGHIGSREFRVKDFPTKNKRKTGNVCFK